MRTKAQIATINDVYRHTMISDRHKTVMTKGVADSPDREQIISCVQKFSHFTGENDSHKEHDFGSVMVNMETYFFKIDYYDLDHQCGADPQTDDYAIVLTIMRSDEY